MVGGFLGVLWREEREDFSRQQKKLEGSQKNTKKTPNKKEKEKKKKEKEIDKLLAGFSGSLEYWPRPIFKRKRRKKKREKRKKV